VCDVLVDRDPRRRVGSVCYLERATEGSVWARTTKRCIGSRGPSGPRTGPPVGDAAALARPASTARAISPSRRTATMSFSTTHLVSSDWANPGYRPAGPTARSVNHASNSAYRASCSIRPHHPARFSRIDCAASSHLSGNWE
jgi:hypothetical protein